MAQTSMRRGATYAQLTAARHGIRIESAVDDLLEVALQAVAKVLEHGRATGEDDVLFWSPSGAGLRCAWAPTHLVQTATDIDRRLLNNVIDDFGERGQELG